MNGVPGIGSAQIIVSKRRVGRRLEIETSRVTSSLPRRIPRISSYAVAKSRRSQETDHFCDLNGIRACFASRLPSLSATRDHSFNPFWSRLFQWASGCYHLNKLTKSRYGVLLHPFATFAEPTLQDLTSEIQLEKALKAVLEFKFDFCNSSLKKGFDLQKEP
jgi:hypothetical protein